MNVGDLKEYYYYAWLKSHGLKNTEENRKLFDNTQKEAGLTLDKKIDFIR